MANKQTLIDADNVIATINVKIEKVRKGLVADYGEPTNIIAILTEVRTLVGNLPRIDAAPVKHGSWKGWTTSKFTGRYKDYDEPEFKDYVYYTCSECYRKSAIQELYCPQCGARMDGGADNG